MLGIKIQDKRPDGVLSFDLRDILAVIGAPVLASSWRCSDLWYTTSRNGRFEEIRETRRKLSGYELIALASTIHQTIDGRFEARGEGPVKKPWLVILAVDSSWFEVWSSKLKVIEDVKTRFEKVNDLPQGAA